MEARQPYTEFKQMFPRVYAQREALEAGLEYLFEEFPLPHDEYLRYSTNRCRELALIKCWAGSISEISEYIRGAHIPMERFESLMLLLDFKEVHDKLPVG